MDVDAPSTPVIKAAIDKKLAGLTPIDHQPCIFKVHDQLLKLNRKAYKPVLLAIGPYNNHGIVGQGLMEQHKLWYLKQMLERRHEISVEEYIDDLIKLEEKARNCYAELEGIGSNKNDFVQMMLLDGCFIIELFRKSKTPDLRDKHDPIFQLDWMLAGIARDLMLFENQLPYFVLTELFKKSASNQMPHPNRSRHLGEHTINFEQINEITSVQSSTSIDQSVQIERFGDLAISFFSDTLPFRDWEVNESSFYSAEKPFQLCLAHKAITPPLAKMVHDHLEVGKKFKNAEFKHLLDLIHTMLKLRLIDMELHHATKRQEVGVKFKKEEIFKRLFGLIYRVISHVFAKMKGYEEMNQDDDSNEDWNSIPYGTELHEAGVKFKTAEEFRAKLKEDNDWKSIDDAIAFQEAGVELEKAKEFTKLLHGNSNEDDKSKLCGANSKMVQKIMSLPCLNKIENWDSIRPYGTMLKGAGIEFKKAKKFRDTKDMIKSKPNATELKEAGVKFKKAKQCTMFGIKFSSGVLKISPLVVEDETETFFRNLIAYEQHRRPYNDCNYVTDYTCFIDGLLDSPKDVELLRREGIIENLLGNDEDVSTMVNGLGRQVTISTGNSIYAKTSLDLNKHCAKRCNVWKAALRHNYFNTPWALLSVLAAILLLLLTITQTIFSIIN